MSVERRSAAFLDLAVADLDAAEVLARVGNHYAAYHVQQAIEKVTKALLVVRGVDAGTEHRLDVLTDRLPEGDAWETDWSPCSRTRCTRRRSGTRRLVDASRVRRPGRRCSATSPCSVG